MKMMVSKFLLGSTRMGSTDYLPYGEVRQAVGIQPELPGTGNYRGQAPVIWTFRPVVGNIGACQESRE